MLKNAIKSYTETDIEVQHLMYLNCDNVVFCLFRHIIEVQHLMYLNTGGTGGTTLYQNIEVQHLMYLNLKEISVNYSRTQLKFNI